MWSSNRRQRTSMRVPNEFIRHTHDSYKQMNEQKRVVVTYGDVECQHYKNFGIWEAARLVDPFICAELGRRVKAVDDRGEGVELSIWNDGSADLAFVSTDPLTGVLDIGLMVDEHDLSDDVLLGTPTSSIIGDVKVKIDIVQLVNEMVEGREVRVRVRFRGEEDEPDRVVIRVSLNSFDKSSSAWMLEDVDS